MLDKIIFGDNQFFGVNHMSETKSQQQQERFSKLENIINTIDIAYSNGATGFMLHSHPRADDICDYFREHKEYWSDLNLYPCIPHPVKYMNKINEMGMFDTLRDTLKNSSVTNIANMLLKGGVGLLTKDIPKLLQILIDVEMKPFRELNIKAIFLHNMVTDLVLGLNLDFLLNEFYHHVKSKYDTSPAFITSNLPLILKVLKKHGIENPVIMSPVNKLGFFMNPSREECEEVLNNEKVQLIPMAILASGAINPSAAFEYIYSLNNVKSVIFGASSNEHILNTINVIKNYI